MQNNFQLEIKLVVRDENEVKIQQKQLEEMNSLLSEYYILLKNTDNNNLNDIIQIEIVDMKHHINTQEIIIRELENDLVWSY